MPQILLTIVGLLSIGFLSTSLARMLRCPHSVFLVLLGLAGGVLVKRLHGGLPLDLAAQFPDIILYVLLPALIFESGYHIDFNELRQDIVAVSALATAGLFVSCALVALGLHLLGIPWFSALLFGALISATDPVAVVALFKEIGAPRRLATLVEGESLFNDATAIVLFRVLTLSAVSQMISTHAVVDGVVQFFAVTLGGVAVGLLFVVAARLALRWTSHSAAAQVGVSVSAAYLSFLVADDVLHASGVMATLTVSLYVGLQARLDLNREALHSMHALWEFLALCANTLVFLAVGLSVDLDALRGSAAYIPLTLGFVYAARFISVALIMQPLNRSGRIRPVSGAYQMVLSWGGLRGGLALALVLLLPASVPEKSLFLALASAVVLSTLLLNAVTTAPLLDWLGVNRLFGQEEVFYRRSLVQVFERVFASLREAANGDGLSQEVVEEMSVRSFEALGLRRQDEAFKTASLTFDIQQALMNEQEYYREQLHQGVLSRPAYLVLAGMVTQRLELLREKGTEALAEYDYEFPWEGEWVSRTLGRTPRLHSLVTRLEVLLQVELALRGLLAGSDSLARPFVEGWLRGAVRRIADFYRLYPQLSLAVQTQFIAGSVSHSARQALRDMLAADVISTTVHAHGLACIDRIHQDLLREAARRFTPTVRELLKNIPLLAVLPEDALRRIEQAAVRRTYPPTVPVVLEGEEGTAMYVIFSGELEVRGSATAPQKRLSPGDCFGEMALLFHVPRNATVVPLVECELLEIGLSLIDEICRQWPQVRTSLEEIARERELQNQSIA